MHVAPETCPQLPVQEADWPDPLCSGYKCITDLMGKKPKTPYIDFQKAKEEISQTSVFLACFFMNIGLENMHGNAGSVLENCFEKKNKIFLIFLNIFECFTCCLRLCVF